MHAHICRDMFVSVYLHFIINPLFSVRVYICVLKIIQKRSIDKPKCLQNEWSLYE